MFVIEICLSIRAGFYGSLQDEIAPGKKGAPALFARARCSRLNVKLKGTRRASHSMPGGLRRRGRRQATRHENEFRSGHQRLVREGKGARFGRLPGRNAR
jgi:hypothetical protein